MPARDLKMLQELCGERTFRNVVIVICGWQESGLHFGLITNKGAQLAYSDHTIASVQNIIRLILNNHSLSRTQSSDQNATVYHSIDNRSGGGEADTLSVESGHLRNSHYVRFPLGFHSLASVTYIP